MTERGSIPPFESPAHRFVSPEDRISLNKDKLMNTIITRAEVVRDQLVDSKIDCNATIGVVIDLWPENVIEPKGCWIITNRQSVLHKLGNMVVDGNNPQVLTEGYALMRTGEVVKYETSQDIDKKPELLRVINTNLNSTDTKLPFDPEDCIANGVMSGFNVLENLAKIASK